MGHLVDPDVLALHVYYWTKLFELNNWTLYELYQKHLPADRRHEVDDLINLMMTRSPAFEIERAIESILVAVWDAEDWNAVIRDPSLLSYEPRTPEELAEWQRLLDAS
jgi:hypothetical protein